jgi:hypothetical protein
MPRWARFRGQVRLRGQPHPHVGRQGEQSVHKCGKPLTHVFAAFKALRDEPLTRRLIL